MKIALENPLITVVIKLQSVFNIVAYCGYKLNPQYYQMEIKKTKTESTQNSNQVQASDQFLATNKAEIFPACPDVDSMC
jgi:hypothetical protein